MRYHSLLSSDEMKPAPIVSGEVFDPITDDVIDVVTPVKNPSPSGLSVTPEPTLTLEVAVNIPVTTAPVLVVSKRFVLSKNKLTAPF